MRRWITGLVLIVFVGAACLPRPLETAAPVADRAAPVAAAATPTVAVAKKPERSASPRRLVPMPLRMPVQPATRPLPNGLLDGLAFDVSNDYGLVVEDLLSGAREALNETKVFPSASIYKLGVAWSVLRRADAQQLNLDQQLTIEDEDAVEVEPDGGVAPGDAPTIREALAAMLSVSSNAAAHALLRLVGRAEVNQEMDRIGLTQTRVPENQSEHDLQSDATAVTSASDVAHLLRLIASSPLLNTGSRNELSQWLASPDPPDALRDTLPDGVSILDKTGNLDDASNVGALLHSARGTVILVVLDQGVDPGDARAVIAHLGQAAYQAFLQSD